MNTPILFLLGAVALSGLGGIIVWIASRPRPERFGSSIDTFNRDLSALAPPSSSSTRRRRHARPAALARPHDKSAADYPAPRNGSPNTSPSVSTPGSQQTKPLGRFKPVPQDTSMGARPKPGPRPGPRS